jgi:hypothetical protein
VHLLRVWCGAVRPGLTTMNQLGDFIRKKFLCGPLTPLALDLSVTPTHASQPRFPTTLPNHASQPETPPPTPSASWQEGVPCAFRTHAVFG